MVPVEEDEGAGAVAHGDAHAIAIGIGANDDVGTFFFRQVTRHLQGGGDLGIGRDHGGETPVGEVLLGHGEKRDAEVAQELRHMHRASPVDRGEDDLE